ncbi:hypothetical protein [Halobacillus litoralis]|uniref:Uncharacterized protein n=1 Tax=Halobacillus litoralis TaxID=45668 RepID=A0A410MCG5_9BACI|nr:hypothetical protein [Halobacillus litoralis]QAS52421.1 hypothetical protein HLI_09325 [Halobacillus litoralis]
MVIFLLLVLIVVILFGKEIKSAIYLFVGISFIYWIATSLFDWGSNLWENHSRAIVIITLSIFGGLYGFQRNRRLADQEGLIVSEEENVAHTYNKINSSTSEYKQDEENDFKEYFHLYNQAKDLEGTSPLESLELYIHILTEYRPKGMNYYERPTYILEEIGSYQEAIDICDRAIKEIENNLFKGDLYSFKDRRERLLQKQTKYRL